MRHHRSYLPACSAHVILSSELRPDHETLTQSFPSTLSACWVSVKNLLPPRSKLLVYFANVHSHLNYAISAWGPMLKARDLKKLKTQQNKSIRLIYNIGKRTRLLPLYKKGNILMISDLINLSLLKISYRYINGILPVRIANLFNLSNHQHNTRNRNSLRAPQHTTEHYNKSYLGRAPHLWIHLRDSLKNKPSLKTFAKSFTKYTVSNYWIEL